MSPFLEDALDDEVFEEIEGLGIQEVSDSDERRQKDQVQADHQEVEGQESVDDQSQSEDLKVPVKHCDSGKQHWACMVRHKLQCGRSFSEKHIMITEIDYGGILCGDCFRNPE